VRLTREKPRNGHRRLRVPVERQECLRVSWFMNLFDARRKVTDRKVEYNEQRPHSSLGYRTPAKFAAWY
jgi:transposase InsO family protein